MKSAKAFSPGNITCFFAIIPHKNPLKKGSLGVSFAVSKGAVSEVKKNNRTEIIVDGTKKRFPTVETALKILTHQPVKAIIKTQLPIGCGYGMSGACTLATLLAANKVLNLNKTREELALIAHTAEVINNTGLGSVTAEYLGGLLIRDKKGKPLEARHLPINTRTIYYAAYNPIDTSTVITSEEMKKKINTYGKKYITQASKNKLTLQQLLYMSKRFAQQTGILQDTKIIKRIESIEKRNGQAAMNMLGKSIYSTIPFKGSKKMNISTKGAQLL